MGKVTTGYGAEMKWFMLIVVLTLMPFMAHAEDADAYKVQGSNAASSGDFKEAIRLYTEAIKLMPSDGAAYSFRGMSYLQLGKFKEAEEDLGKAIEFRPDFAGGWMGRASTRLKMSQFEGAAEDATEAVRLRPDLAAGFFVRGNAFRQLGRFKEAISDFDQAIQLEPDTPSLYLSRGETFASMGQVNRAREDAAKALSYGSDNPAAKQFQASLVKTIDPISDSIVDTIHDTESFAEADRRVLEEISRIRKYVPELLQNRVLGEIYPVLSTSEVDRIRHLMKIFERLEDLNVENYSYTPGTRSFAKKVLDDNERALKANQESTEFNAQQATQSAPEPDTGGLVAYYISFLIADYCAKAGASFTTEEASKIQAEVKIASDNSGFNQEQKDKAWSASQFALDQQKSHLSYESCSADRKQMTYTMPKAFVPDATAAPNPF